MCRESDQRESQPERFYSQEDFCIDLGFLLKLAEIEPNLSLRFPRQQAYFAGRYSEERDRAWYRERCWKAAEYWTVNQLSWNEIEVGSRIIGTLSAATQLTLWEYWANRGDDLSTFVLPFDEFLERNAEYERELERLASENDKDT
jgi:hypothetical protein